MEKYCLGKMKNKMSVNDDLEIFFEDLQLGKQTDNSIGAYFLPKLNAEELALVAKKDSIYMGSFVHGPSADVTEAAMIKSDSDSKFVRGDFRRQTFIIENSSPETESKSTEDGISNYCSVQ